jgi:hypothetical protein
MEWLPRQWLIGVPLAAVAVGGLFLARDAASDAGYWGGLLLFGLSVLGVFAAISDAFEPLPIGRLKSMPENGALRYAVGGIVGALGIYGLLRSSEAGAEANGFIYYVGLSMFATAVAYDFLLIKDWFDRSQTAAQGCRPGSSSGSSHRGSASAGCRSDRRHSGSRSA